jgi:acyl carrier protein
VIDELARGGAAINTAAIDVADRQSMSSLLSTIDRSGAPLRGLIHAAGILDDGVVATQTWERFERVMSPKVTGAWNLHALTEQLPLDFCVYFSSLAGVVGSPGQGSYAAANAALDALAQHRRAAGGRALSVSWGLWSGGGMAGSATADVQRRWRAQGIGMIGPDEGLELLGELMAQGGAHAVVAPIDWQKFRRAGGAAVPAFFEDLFSSDPGEPQGTDRAETDVLAVWRAAPPKRRRGLILASVRSQVAAALGLDAEAGGSARQPLSELGLDSLMAVEIRNALGLKLGMSLPATLLFDYPTIESLAEYLDTQIFGEAQPGEAASAAELPADLDDVLTTVEQMSDRDVEAAFLSRPKA